MSFPRKLIRPARDFPEAMAPEVERELTIAEDYPDKWAEIQWRRRTLNFLLRIFWAGFLALALFVLYGILVVPASDEQRALAINIACPAAIIFMVSQTCAKWFFCPRCHRTFRDPHQSDFKDAIYYGTTRCQHCDLKRGEAPEFTRVQ